MGGVLERMQPASFEMTVVCTKDGARNIQASMPTDDLPFLFMPADFSGASKAIHDGQFDVLYHWEVGTGLTNYLLPFMQLAPVQCTGWGLPVTSGAPHIHHYLSSALVEPEKTDDHYSESLICASTLLTFQRRMARPDAVRAREDFGFSPDHHVYLCPQKSRKIHPEFDSILARIFKRDRSAVVVIFGDVTSMSPTPCVAASRPL